MAVLVRLVVAIALGCALASAFPSYRTCTRCALAVQTARRHRAFVLLVVVPL